MSLWNETVGVPKFDTLNGDIKTDVLVIGGGIAGILCAWRLKKAGVNCTLVEARRILSGVTAGTTAKITVQHGLIYDKLIKEFGTERARQYLESNLAALKEYRKLSESYNFDLEEKPSAVYSLDDRGVIEKEVRALGVLGFTAEFSEELPLPFEKISGAVVFPEQAQMDPYKLLSCLACEIDIYENTKVTELVPGGARYENDRGGNGRITAGKIVVATHFPFINKHGSYFIKQYQQRSYVIAFEGAPDVGGMYIDAAEGGMSFRNAGGYLLLGGGGHRTGAVGGGYNKVKAFADRYYPGCTEKYRWATQDCMTLDGVPYVGRYSASTDGLYVITGFNKWGMTSAMAASRVICDLITTGRSQYGALYSPSRTIFRSQLAKNAWHYTSSVLSFKTPRCPHLGCVLKWNKQEHSWDCPCHGSRFSADGKLLDNPATGNLKKAEGPPKDQKNT